MDLVREVWIGTFGLKDKLVFFNVYRIRKSLKVKGLVVCLEGLRCC